MKTCWRIEGNEIHQPSLVLMLIVHLSKELKELELNSVVKRNVYNSTPVRIEYTLTESGKNILSVLDSMIEWGLAHRTSIMNQKQN